MDLRRFNWPLLIAPVLAVSALLSYLTVFVKWPLTRDVPWVNLGMFALAGWALVAGNRRAWRAERLRVVRRLWAAALTLVCAAALALFIQGRFILAADLPASSGAPQVGQRAPDFTLPDEHGRPVSLPGLLAAPMPTGTQATPPKAVLLVFYMYSGCRACNSEFRGLQQHLDALTTAGVRPVAISIDTPEVSRALSEEAGYTFPFLSDPQMAVIRRYDVADQEQGARPAEFLVDASGVVRWRYLTKNLFVRATAEDVLEAVKALP
jgi:mycoredoxin-dependent peroxiredoxin